MKSKNVLISYDLTAGQAKVRAKMIELGYVTELPHTNELKIPLPTTTLIWKGSGKTQRDVFTEFGQVVSNLNRTEEFRKEPIDITSCICIAYSPEDMDSVKKEK